MVEISMSGSGRAPAGQPAGATRPSRASAKAASGLLASRTQADDPGRCFLQDLEPLPGLLLQRKEMDQLLERGDRRGPGRGGRLAGQLLGVTEAPGQGGLDLLAGSVIGAGAQQPAAFFRKVLRGSRPPPNGSQMDLDH